MNPLVRELLPVLGMDQAYAAARLEVGPGNGLPSALPVNTLACGSVAAAGLSATRLFGGERVQVDPRQVAVSFRGDQVLTVDGASQPSFAPLSGFFRTSDGWVRTHANYPHHRARLVRALGLPDDAGQDEAARVLAAARAQEVEDVVTADHGIAVRVRDLRQWRSEAQSAAVDAHPLLAVELVADSSPPTRMDGPVRVLDLTRVIAGPVATRTLALFGCDVLRVDGPLLPELDAAHLDMDAGKRSTIVDLTESHARQRIHELLADADVLVTGYRPSALAAYHLAEVHPHLVHATLSAWTPSGPWGARRGFDSIVQAATGIAMIESPDGYVPGALPAQALDHATGYLLAAGICTALTRRAEDGGTWRVAAHLARTAHWLLGTDALDAPATPLQDVEPWTATVRTEESGTVRLARPAFRVDDGLSEYGRVGHRFGADEPAWL